MMLHTYTPPQPISTPGFNFVYPMVLRSSTDNILKVKVTTARSNQGHVVTSHTFIPQPMSFQIINILHLIVSKICLGQDFQTQGHYGKIKDQIKVTL